MYVSNNRASKHVRQKLKGLQGKINESIVSGGHFNTPLSEMGRPKRQKISKGVVELHNTINQLDIMGMHGLLHPVIAEYTFFSSSYGHIHQDRPYSGP